MYRKWFNSAIASIAVKPSYYDSMIAEGKTKAIKKKVEGRTMRLPDFVGVDSSFELGRYLVESISLSGISLQISFNLSHVYYITCII